ncbi:MAG: PEP-CTERM sorting domain-containing protein [Verrucomicrobiales bacterium]
MKRRSHASTTAAAAILTGGLLFSGSVSAVVVFSEDFDGATNQFGMPTYAYADNYTQPNVLTPGGGVNYGHGGGGVGGQISTNDFGPVSVSIVTLELPTGVIDSGLGTYNFYAQFSTYLTQNDYAEITLTFKDGANADVGSPVAIGGSAFVTGLGSGPSGREWGASSLSGAIPAGARSASILLAETKTAGGTNIDGYVDNISLNVQPVPEPGTASLLLLGLAGLLRRRRGSS